MIPIPADVKILFKADSADARAEIDLLKKEIGYLREGFKRTQEAATVGNNALARFRGETIALTHVFVSSIDDFGGALNQFDRRFLGFHERVDAFTGAIHRLPPEITAVRDAFDVLAPTAARVEAVFADIELSLVDTETEALAFRNVFSGLSHDLTSFAADQAIATAEIRLVNPAISAAVGSLRDYNEVLLESGVNFGDIDDISNRLTHSIRDQASAFSEVSRAAETAGIDISDALDMLDAEIEPVGNREISNLELVLQSLGDNSGNVLDQLIGDFSQLDGVVGELGTKLGQFDIAGLASGNPLALASLPLQLYNAFTFDQRQADAQRPELDRQNRASFERGEFGIPSDLLGFGRGQLDTAAGAVGQSGFGGRSLLELLDNLDPQIGRTTLDEVATIPDRIIETIQTFTDQAIEGLTDELSKATFNLNFARQTGGDVEGALQDVIRANTALYQTQIDSYNLQRQATGRAVGNVVELNRILNGLNNQSRLAIADLTGPQNAQQFIAANNITRGLTAPTDDQERGVVFDPNAAADTGTRSTGLDDILDGISDLDISNLQGIADDAIAVFRDTLTAPARTIESINTAFEALLPDLQTLYDSIREQIIGTDGIISEAEQIQLNNLGSFEDFTQQYANLRDQAIEGVNATQQRLAITSQQIATGEGIRQFGELANAPNATIEGLTTAWTQNVLPLVNALYDDLFAQVAGPDGFINTADEKIAFLGLGSREDFVSDYENNILTPALDSLTTIKQNIAQLLQGHELDDTFDNFNDAILAPGQTIEGLTSYWEANVVPVLRTTYNGFRAEIIGEDGLISPAELEQLISMGLDLPFENWAGQYKDGILTPGLERLTSAAQVIASITQSREQEDVIEMFNEAITAPGQTIEGINTYWIDNVIPVLRATYEQMRADVIGEDGITSPEEAAELTRRGLDIPFEDWASPYEDNILTPGIDRLSGAAAVIASLTQSREQSSIIAMFNAAAVAPGATIEGINQYWVDNVVPVLRTTYASLRNEIIGEDGLISPEEASELTRRGLDLPFEDWVTPYENDILTPATDSLSQAAQVIASVTQSGEQSAVIDMFNESVKAPGATIEGISAFWNSNVVPELRQTFDGLRNQIIGADGLISPQELAALTQAGLNVPFEDWAGQFRADIFEPGVAFLEGEAEYLQSTELSTGVDNVIEMWKEQVAAPGATIAGLTEAWNQNVVPALRSLYQDLYDDIAGPDGIINTAREEADLLRLGTEEEFIAGFGEDVFTPLTTSLSRGRSQTGSNLARNQVNTARFNLGQSGSEGDFDTNRGILLQAIEAFYTAEEARIRALGLSADQLTDQLQALNLARSQEIQGVIDLDNRFQTERLDMEQGTQDKISDLREDALDNEQDRQQALVDLSEDAARRREDIEEDHQRRLEDIRRDADERGLNRNIELQRDIEDLFSESGVAVSDEQRSRLTRGIQTGFDPNSLLEQLGINLDSGTLSSFTDITRDFERGTSDESRSRFFDEQEAAVRQQRAQEDLERRTTEREAGINEQATATATAIQEALTPLLADQQTGEVAEKQTTAADKQIEAADAQTTAAEKTETAATDLMNATTDLGTVSEDLRSVDIPGLFEVVRESAEASLGIAGAIEALPVLLEESFDRIFEELSETIIELLQVQSGIRGGIGEFLVSELANAESDTSTALGQITAVALRNLGIDPEQFAPQQLPLPLQTAADVMDVNVANPMDIYDPARIEELRGEGLNNREIGQILRDTAGSVAIPEPDMTQATQTAVDFQARSVSIQAGSVSVSGTVTGQRNPERPGIIPIPVPVGEETDNRLFHFAETDAIANRLARSASLNRARPAPYFPTQDQIRNAKDVSREIVQGFVEGLSQRNSGFVGEGAREQPQTIVIENKMQMPSGVVKEISRERIILNEQGDFLDV